MNEVFALRDELAALERLKRNGEMLNRPPEEIAEIDHMIARYQVWIAEASQ